MAKLSYHQRKYPQLYAGGPGGISDILLSDAQYMGPKTYPGATGEGFDPLGLMKPNGKGTGLDLIPKEKKKKEKKKKNNRPTGPSSGMTIPSSAYMEDDDDDLLARMSALDMMQPNAMGGKITNKKEPKEDRPKGLFGFLDGVELDGDALIKAGRSLQKGEGLGGAIEAYRDKQLANQAADAAKAEKKYDRERQAELDKLDMAVKMNEIEYKKSQMQPDEIKLAETAAITEAAAQGVELNTVKFAEIYADKLDMIINKEKPMTSSMYTDNMTLDQLIGTFGSLDGKNVGTGGTGGSNEFIDGTNLMNTK